MTTKNSSGNFFEDAFESAKAWVEEELGIAESKIVPIEQSIAKYGNAVVNEFKILEANPKIQLLADWFVKIAEAIDPGLTPLIQGIELEFPKIVSIATGVVGEVSKPIEEQLGDGLTALTNITAANSTIGSSIKGGISAAIQAFAINNNPETVAPATDSQLIVAAHLVHSQAS